MRGGSLNMVPVVLYIYVLYILSISCMCMEYVRSTIKGVSCFECPILYEILTFITPSIQHFNSDSYTCGIIIQTGSFVCCHTQRRQTECTSGYFVIYRNRNNTYMFLFDVQRELCSMTVLQENTVSESGII